MNTRSSPPVPAFIRRPSAAGRIALCVIAVGSSGTGCIDINGGAAEVSWSLRSFEGEAVETCGEVEIRDVRLCWEPLTDGGTTAGEDCRREARRSFPCDESSGVTGFQLDPGLTAFWIEPLCTDGQPADPVTYQVPPPIVRMVEDGKIVSLNSLLLVVSPDRDGCGANGCTCMRQ